MAGVYDPDDNCDLELALAKYLWKIQVNILLSGAVKPTIERIQKHLKEVCASGQVFMFFAWQEHDIACPLILFQVLALTLFLLLNLLPINLKRKNT